jgi:hypothetical protein
MMKSFLLHTLAGFRTVAKTLGLSPKALAPLIGAGITALLALVGLSPAEIGSWVGVSPEVAAGAVLVVAGSVAAWLLRPGIVVKSTT